MTEDKSEAPEVHQKIEIDHKAVVEGLVPIIKSAWRMASEQKPSRKAFCRSVREMVNVLIDHGVRP